MKALKVGGKTLLLWSLLFYLSLFTECTSPFSSNVTISWNYDCRSGIGGFPVTTVYSNSVEFTLHLCFKTSGSGKVKIIVTTEEDVEESQKFNVKDNKEYHLRVRGNRDPAYNDSHRTKIYIDSPQASGTEDFSVASKDITIKGIEIELYS